MNKKILSRTICFIVLISVSIFSNYACKNKNQQNNPPVPLEKISWETERSAEYKLIRPIEYETWVKDAYGFPIVSGDWYLISAKSQCNLLPINMRHHEYDLINELRMESDPSAVIDTMFASHMSEAKNFEGLSGINKIQILCLRGYTVKPEYGYRGKIFISLQKK